MIPLLIVMSC